MERPTCKTCAYYDAEAKTTVYMPGAGGYSLPGGPLTIEKKGACKRHWGAPSHKLPDDWCGDHHDFPAYIASLKQDGQPNP